MKVLDSCPAALTSYLSLLPDQTELEYICEPEYPPMMVSELVLEYWRSYSLAK